MRKKIKYKMLLEICLAFIVPYFGLSLIFRELDRSRFVKYRHNFLDDMALVQKRLDNSYYDVGGNVLFNILGLFPFLTYMVYDYVEINNESYCLFESLCHIFYFSLIFEIFFYLSHRLAHSSKIYKHVHYIHHTMVETIGFGALYCHWIEFIFCNYLPSILGIFSLGSTHINTIYIWMILTASYIVITHSGYNVGNDHYYHHLTYSAPYGSFGLMDYLFNNILKL